ISSRRRARVLANEVVTISPLDRDQHVQLKPDVREPRIDCNLNTRLSPLTHLSMDGSICDWQIKQTESKTMDAEAFSNLRSLDLSDGDRGAAFRDPYDVCLKSKRRDIGPYKDLFAIEAGSIDFRKKMNVDHMIQISLLSKDADGSSLRSCQLRGLDASAKARVLDKHLQYLYDEWLGNYKCRRASAKRDYNEHSILRLPNRLKPVHPMFESVVFKRTSGSAKIQNEMQSRIGLIEAIVFEVKDTERIGGNFLKNSSNVLCCNPKLSADRSCTAGKVIIQKDENNPDWPKRIQTFFDGNNQEAKMPTQSVEIDKTVTISAIKKTVSRLLLLVVAMGYGVVRPTLGGMTSKVLILRFMRRSIAKLEVLIRNAIFLQ
ncbi:hypothetical protein M8C21_002122, partial [Ambrosia artemisiifolia]